MKQKEMYATVGRALEGLAAAGYSGIDVRKGYNFRVVGAPTKPSILLWNIGNHRYGFTAKDDQWHDTGPDAGVMVHTETQAREVTLQATVYLPLPATAAGPGTNGATGTPDYTAYDLANAAASVLASDAGLKALADGGLGIERIANVRQPYWEDATDQFQLGASFDFVLCFTQRDYSTTPIVLSKELKVVRV